MNTVTLDLGSQMNELRNFNGEHFRKSFCYQFVGIRTLKDCYLEVKEAFPSFSVADPEAVPWVTLFARKPYS